MAGVPRGLGNVRWLGGDWNTEPHEADAQWYRSEAVMLRVGTATQRLGRNIDRVLYSIKVPVQGVATRVPGTDHVGVRMAQGPLNDDALGTKLELPSCIGAATLADTGTDSWEQKLMKVLGNPPEEFGQWTKGAESGLLQVLGIQRRGTAHKGRPIRYKKQAINQCQDGK